MLKPTSRAMSTMFPSSNQNSLSRVSLTSETAVTGLSFSETRARFRGLAWLENPRQDVREVTAENILTDFC